MARLRRSRSLSPAPAASDGARPRAPSTRRGGVGHGADGDRRRPYESRSVTDQPVSADAVGVRPRPCSTPSPPTRSPRSTPRSRAPSRRADATRSRPSSRTGRGSSTRGRGSASSRATTSRRTRASGSAYHRGLDRLRQIGLARLGLRALAARDEPRLPARARRPAARRRRDRRGTTKQQRCAEFLHQLDPDWDRHDPALTYPRSAMKRALDHGHHRPGRPPHVGVPRPARATRCSASSGARTTRRPQLVLDENPALELVEGDLRDLSSLIAAVEQVQPDEVYNLGAMSFVRAVVPPARAHRRHHRPRRAPHARGDPHRRRHRQQPDPLLPGVVVGDVRQGPRDAADRAARPSTRARRTASPRCSATT